MPVLLIDNYDSFTWNLVQAMLGLGARVDVRRHDDVTVRQALHLRPSHLVISPGPCTPRQSGISCALIAACTGHIPILGVCLGHQCIAFQRGASIRRARRPIHGRTSRIRHDGRGVFQGLPNPLDVARYHSLAVEASTLPSDLLPTAHARDGELMGLRHAALPVEGVQFHPESFMTEAGTELMRNFLRMRV